MKGSKTREQGSSTIQPVILRAFARVPDKTMLRRAIGESAPFLQVTNCHLIFVRVFVVLSVVSPQKSNESIHVFVNNLQSKGPFGFTFVNRDDCKQNLHSKPEDKKLCTIVQFFLHFYLFGCPKKIIQFHSILLLGRGSNPCFHEACRCLCPSPRSPRSLLNFNGWI